MLPTTDGHTPIIKVYDDTATRRCLHWEQTRQKSASSRKMKRKCRVTILLTYTNRFDIGNHNLTATAGFTTYYNSLSRLDGAHKQGVDLVIPDDPDKWFVSIGDAATWLPTEVPNGNGLRYPYLHVWSTTTKENTCSTVSFPWGWFFRLLIHRQWVAELLLTGRRLVWPKKSSWRISNGSICWKSKHLTVH